MPKTKKQADSSNESDSDSGPEDKNPPPKKSKKDTNTSKALKNSDGEPYWELDRAKRITVSEFKGKLLIGIREFYEKDGKMLPGKKGISLSVSQWNTLKGVINEVDDAIRDKA